MRSRDGAPDAVLAITSAVANEGKTLTSSNLAVALARRGEKVVLVDLDVRKPSLADVFRIPARSPGIVQALAGHVRIDDVLWKVALDEQDQITARTVVPDGRQRIALSNGSPTGSPGGSLSVIPAGAAVRGGVAQSKRLPELLAELRKRADVVLLDTPPALQAAEMAELSQNVDGVIVVVRQGTVSHRNLRGLNRQAQSWRAKPIGAVLTDAVTSDRAYYYARR